MGKVIRIDDEVWRELKKHGEAFEDTPNDALRRLLKLSRSSERSQPARAFIPKDKIVTSKQEFVELLREWAETSEETIGEDVGSYGGTPWLYVELENDRFVLNADTTREGVEQFLGFHESDGSAWYVIPNARGVANKVTSDPDRRPIRGFFMYANRRGARTI